MPIDRGRFLGALGGAGVLGAYGSAGRLAWGATGSGPAPGVPIPELVNGSIVATGLANLPSPQESGIEHIVVVTMENRSFDHFLGWLPGADGKQAALFRNVRAQGSVRE